MTSACMLATRNSFAYYLSSITPREGRENATIKRSHDDTTAVSPLHRGDVVVSTRLRRVERSHPRCVIRPPNQDAVANSGSSPIPSESVSLSNFQRNSPNSSPSPPLPHLLSPSQLPIQTIANIHWRASYYRNVNVGADSREPRTNSSPIIRTVIGTIARIWPPYITGPTPRLSS